MLSISRNAGILGCGMVAITRIERGFEAGMKEKQTGVLFRRAAVIYWLFVLVIFLVANKQLRFEEYTAEAGSASVAMERITDEMAVEQSFTAPGGTIEEIEILVDSGNNSNDRKINLKIFDDADQLVMKKTASFAECIRGDRLRVVFDRALDTVADGSYLLVLQTEGCSADDEQGFCCGVTPEQGWAEQLSINGETRQGMLALNMAGQKERAYYILFWPFCLLLFLVAVWALCRSSKMARAGKASIVAHIALLTGRYSFLVKQLISRDFKTKYKRSVLGVAWSFLNPLLTMCVQYIVFSTLFQRNTANYPVYLLTGIVFFNFFNEAINMGMTSITSNASLIKKVYMPRYIYPLTRVVSSLINFLIALVPLLFVMLVTGTAFTPALLLLPFDIVCLFVFVCGMGLLLSTSMTFFQDTKFLWSVTSMLWMYLTPIFYTESIIPRDFLPIYRLNPMYQFITFARTCIIDGVSPEPVMYIQCMLSAACVFAAGIWVFKKNHNKFIMHI